MNICLGFFGFVRDMIKNDDFQTFLKILPDKSNIDIFISCPTKINELAPDTSEIDEKNFREHMQSVFVDRTVLFNFYKYKPSEFIIKTRKAKIPDYMPKTKLFAFRILSLHYSISLLSKTICDYIKKENKDYDRIILTRFDIFPLIKSLGNCLSDRSDMSINIWRTTPYTNLTCAEDRVIITSKLGLEKLQDLYNIYADAETYNKFGINNDDFSSEHILGRYLNTFEEISKKPQTNIVMGLSPYLGVKYNNNDYFNNLLREV